MGAQHLFTFATGSDLRPHLKRPRMAEIGQSGFRALLKESDIVQQPILIHDDRPGATPRRIRRVIALAGCDTSVG
jgi:hypothetical protein